MPQKRNNSPRLRRGASSEPPPVMTWGKALPVLIIAVIFDALRFMFEWFILFGPAIAAAYCTAKGSSYIGITASGVLCSAGATVGGFFGATFIGPFGMIMAIVTGLAGWLVILILLLIFNGRIFKENALWFGASLLVSEVPFVGSIPALTIVMWRMHHVQIKIEKEALKKWKKENADAQLQERRQQIAEQAQMIQYQAGQVAQAQQEAANDAMAIEAANDERIPEEVRKAA